MSMIGRRKVAALALIPIITAACGGGGGGGSDSPSVQLPEISEQPVDREISSGSPVSFSVQVKTSTDVKFQWKKNGVNIGGTDGGTAVVDSGTGNSGSTIVKSSISYNEISAADSGSTFSVTISNAAGSVESRQAILKVSTAGIEIIGSTFLARVLSFDNNGGSFCFESNQITGETHLIRRDKSGTKINLIAGLEKYKLERPSRSTTNAIDHQDGSIYIVESFYTYATINVEETIGGRITRISPSGVVTTLHESSTFSPRGLVIDDEGTLFTVDSSVNDLYSFKPTGELTKITSLGAVYSQYIFDRTVSLARTEDGTLYSCINTRQLTNAVRISKNGTVTIISSGDTVEGKIFYPKELSAYKNKVYILADQSENSYPPSNQIIREFDSEGKISLIAGTVDAKAEAAPGPLPGIIGRTKIIDISMDGKIYLRRDSDILVVTPKIT